jgi:hypothetical protein
MSTSIGSLVGGVSLTLPSTSDDLELRVTEEVTSLDEVVLDSGVRICLVADVDLNTVGPDGLEDLVSGGFPKKFMRLFCFMFSVDFCFSGTFGGAIVIASETLSRQRRCRQSANYWH